MKARNVVMLMGGAVALRAAAASVSTGAVDMKSMKKTVSKAAHKAQSMM